MPIPKHRNYFTHDHYNTSCSQTPSNNIGLTIREWNPSSASTKYQHPASVEFPYHCLPTIIYIRATSEAFIISYGKSLSESEICLLRPSNVKSNRICFRNNVLWYCKSMLQTQRCSKGLKAILELQNNTTTLQLYITQTLQHSRR